MGLVKRHYIDQETVITAGNMNEIQDAILDLEDGLFSVDNNKSGEVISITDAAKRGFRSLNIYGKTTQDGTPTPDAPMNLVSVGDKGSVNISVAEKNMFQFIGKATVENGTIIESSSVGGTFKGNDGTNPGSTSWSSGWAHFDRTVPLYLRQGTVITVSADYTVLEKHSSAKDKISIIFNSHSGPSALNMKDAEVGVKYRISRTLVVPEDGQYTRTTFSTHSSKVKIENVQWEIGAVASDFVPYNEQILSVSTSNGLPGIPIASGGNYTDANGQQWVCDEIDFFRGVYVQRIGPTNLAGVAWVKNDSGKYFTTKNHGLYSNAHRVVCTHIKGGFPSDANKENVIFINANNDIRLNITLDNDTVEAVQETMNGATLIGVLVSPIETPLTEEELAAYASLHTYKDNTTVSNDAGAYMELEYVMDAKKYIDSLVTGSIVPATVE